MREYLAKKVKQILSVDSDTRWDDPMICEAGDDLAIEVQGMLDHGQVYVVGNPAHGFTVYGPYYDADEAFEKHQGEDGWLMKLEGVED